MPTAVRSYSKINLGLAVGPPRPDGFHALTTLYQTLALHDFVTVTAAPAAVTSIRLSSNDPRVPLDARNTAWKMAEKALDALALTAEVNIHISKKLPIQGGMGAGSANAAATLIGLEQELSLRPPAELRLRLAAEVGSDVPLFLIGGSVFGTDRGQAVAPAPPVTLAGVAEIPCVIALPARGVSTPQAFRDWDRRFTQSKDPGKSTQDLHKPAIRDTLKELSCTYASVFPQGQSNEKYGASGIFPELSHALHDSPEKLHGLSREQHHQPSEIEGTSGFENDLAGNSLLALVRTGIENDFETVVFLQYPLLREIKRHLMGSSEAENRAVYAALSGSGSALFGLYRCQADAAAAQQRLQQHGVQAIVTSTLPRPLYWSNMFAE